MKFAFNFSHGSLKKSFLALAAGGSSSGKGLGGLDGAAQAGMILLEVNQLAPARRRIIEARFLPQTKPCSCRSPCCRGTKDTAEWREAMEWLIEYVLVHGLTASISHYRLRRAVVRRYFGERESFPKIARANGVHTDTASDLNKRVAEHFKAEEHAALRELDARLKGAGIVSS